MNARLTIACHRRSVSDTESARWPRTAKNRKSPPLLVLAAAIVSLTYGLTRMRESSQSVRQFGTRECRTCVAAASQLAGCYLPPVTRRHNAAFTEPVLRMVYMVASQTSDSCAGRSGPLHLQAERRSCEQDFFRRRSRGWPAFAPITPSPKLLLNSTSVTRGNRLIATISKHNRIAGSAVRRKYGGK